MKSADKQINFDFIGSQDPLTEEDIELIKLYFKSKK